MHEINVEGVTPFKMKPSRVAQINELLEEMERDGLI